MQSTQKSGSVKRPEILDCPGKQVGVLCRFLASLSRTTQFGLWRVPAALGRAFPRFKFLALDGPDGNPFLVDMTDGGFQFVMHGWGEAEIHGVIEGLPDDAISIDVGAHWGTWARMIATQCPHGRVYAIEASRSTFETLLANCSKTRNVSCVNKAILQSTGTAWFSGTSTTAGLRHIETEAADGAEQVEGISLGELMAELCLDRLDFIKVDVEGFECDVILPALSELYRLRTIICFEYIPSFEGRATVFETGVFFEELQRQGYRVSRLDLNGKRVSLDNKQVGLSNNYLAVPAG